MSTNFDQHVEAEERLSSLAIQVRNMITSSNVNIVQLSRQLHCETSSILETAVYDLSLDALTHLLLELGYELNITLTPIETTK